MDLDHEVVLRIQEPGTLPKLSNAFAKSFHDGTTPTNFRRRIIFMLGSFRLFIYGSSS